MTTTNSVESPTASSSSSSSILVSSSNHREEPARALASDPTSTSNLPQPQQPIRPQPPLMHSVSIVVDLAKEREHSLDSENHGTKDNLSKSIEEDNDNYILTSNFREKTATEGTAMATTTATATMATITSALSSLTSSSSSTTTKIDSKTMSRASGNCGARHGHSHEDYYSRDGDKFRNINKMERGDPESGEEDENYDDESDFEVNIDAGDDDDEEEEEEEEDGNDETDCLRSDLARKVVIVDEADKILRNRAYSAEPRICIKALESVYERNIFKSPTTTSDGDGDGDGDTSIRNRGQGVSQLCNIVDGQEIDYSSLINKRSNTLGNIDSGRLKEKYEADLDRKQMVMSSELSGGGMRAISSASTSGGGGALSSPSEMATFTSTPTTTPTSDFGGSSDSRKFVIAGKTEPSRLSMRRFTHHHIGSGGFNSAQSSMSSVPSTYSTEQTGIATSTSASSAPKTVSNTLPALSPLPSIRSSINHSIRATVQPAARLGSAQLTGFPSPRVVGSEIDSCVSGGGSSGGVKLNRNNNIASSFDPLQSPSTTISTSTSTSAVASEATTTGAAISQQIKQPQYPQSRNNLTPTPSQQMKNWSQHRRQSLQISLLTGCASSSPQSISLTEEELRGEREFNEQVRLAKSPDIQALPALTHSRSQQHQLHQQTISKVIPSTTETASYLASNTRTSKASVTQFHTRPRCESLAGGEIFSTECQPHSVLATNVSSLSSSSTTTTTPTNDSVAATTTTSSPSSHLEPSSPNQILTTILQKVGNNKQNQSRFSSTNTISAQNSAVSSQLKQTNKTQRRVSFGSINPILTYSDPESRTHNRASFAYYPTYYQPAPQQQYQTTISANNNPNALFSVSSDTNSSSTDQTSPKTTLTSCESSIDSDPRSPTTITTKEFDFNSTIANYLTKQQPTKVVGQKRHSIATHNYIRSLGELTNTTTTTTTTTLRQHNPSHKRLIDQVSPDPLSQNRRVSVKEISEFINTGKICNWSRKDDTGLIASVKASTHIGRTKMGENNPNTPSAKATTTTVNQQDISGMKSHLDDHESQMETYSTKLEGQDTDDLGITSSTSTKIELASSTQEKDDSRVRSIMANAKLRQEEFARLLEEHEQIVNEINRVETKISSSQTSLQQHNQQQQQLKQPQQEQENNQ